MEIIEQGGIIPEDSQKVDSGKIMILEDMTEISLEILEEFYGE